MIDLKWNPKDDKPYLPFSENWILFLANVQRQETLVLRLDVVKSSNQFRKQVEISAVFSSAEETEKKKVRLVQTFDLSEIRPLPGGGFSLGPHEITSEKIRIQLDSKGRRLEVEQDFQPESNLVRPFAPMTLKNNRRKHHLVFYQPVLTRGKIRLDTQESKWIDTKGVLARSYGRRSVTSWTWSHIPQFSGPSGLSLTAVALRRNFLKTLRFPSIHSFCFSYRGKDFYVNNLSNFIKVRSDVEPFAWKFNTEVQPFSFRVEIVGNAKDFLRVPYEDTDGSLFDLRSSDQATARVSIYENGKFIETVTSVGSTYFETAYHA